MISEGSLNKGYEHECSFPSYKRSISIGGEFSGPAVKRAITTLVKIKPGYPDEEDLRAAVEHGRTVRLMEIIDRCKDETRLPTLLTISVLCAAWYDDCRLLLHLLEKGVNPDSCDYDGRTALHLAAASNAVACVQILVSKGASIDAWDSKREATPLGVAAFTNSLEALQHLINSGADVNAGVDNEGIGTSPLALAVKGGSLDSLTTLLESGAVVLPSSAFEKETVVHIACYHDQHECLEILLNSENLNTGRPNFWKEFLSESKVSENQSTCLHLAAEEGCTNAMRVLIKYSADPNVPNAKKQTPLHLCALAQCPDGVLALLQAGAQVDPEDSNNKTPLHCAIVRSDPDHLECVNHLIAANANVNKQDVFGFTPLHLAASIENDKLVQLLLNEKPDITLRTNGGVSVLHSITKKLPSCISSIVDIMDNCVIEEDNQKKDRAASEIRLNYQFLVPSPGRQESLFFTALIEAGQSHLMSHPLCRSFLHLKSERIKSLFFFSLAQFFVFSVLLTVYCTLGFAESSLDDTFRISDGGICLRTTILIFWVLMVAQETLLFIQCPIRWIETKESYVNVLVMGLSLLCVNTLPLPYVWVNYHVAGLVVVLVWFDFTVKLGRLPSVGVYIHMMHAVTRNILKLMGVFLFMIVGFLSGFRILFPKSKLSEDWTKSFQVIVTAMSDTISTDLLYKDDTTTANANGNMTGVTNMSNVTAFEYHRVTGDAVYIAFIFVIVIVMMNLMVGLAVSDIQAIQRTALLKRLEREVTFIERYEFTIFSNWTRFLPLKVRLWFQRRALVVNTNYASSIRIRPNHQKEKRFPKAILDEILELIKTNYQNRKTDKNKSSFPRKGNLVSMKSGGSETVRLNEWLAELASQIHDLKKENKELMKNVALVLSEVTRNGKIEMSTSAV